MTSTKDGGSKGGESKPDTGKLEPMRGNRNQRQRGQRREFKKPVVKQAKFEGRCEELRGFIYDCSDARQADIFTKTTKEVAEYAGRTCKYSADIRKAIETLENTTIVPPAEPGNNATDTEKRIWEKKVDTYVKRESIYEQNLETMYSVILGQCSDAMRAKLESQDEFERIADESDAVELLKLIKGIAFNFQSQKYPVQSVQETIRHFYLLRQDKQMTCQAYLELFTNSKDVVEHCGGLIGDHPGLIDHFLREAGTD